MPEAEVRKTTKDVERSGPETGLRLASRARSRDGGDGGRPSRTSSWSPAEDGEGRRGELDLTPRGPLQPKNGR